MENNIKSFRNGFIDDLILELLLTDLWMMVLLKEMQRVNLYTIC